MKNINKKAALWIIVTISIALYVLLCNFNKSNINGVKEIFTIISKIITIDSILIAIFSKYLWNIKILKY